VHTRDSAKARALARRSNEFSAELVHSRRDRFGGFACLPLPDVDASLEELSYALDVLGLDGFVLFTNSIGVYLGDPVLKPVFEELERRKTVVYVHPNPSPDAVAHSLGLPTICLTSRQTPIAPSLRCTTRIDSRVRQT
jgi:predicted TIM-barrel fold metal-dependent hydrolase